MDQAQTKMANLKTNSPNKNLNLTKYFINTVKYERDARSNFAKLILGFRQSEVKDLPFRVKLSPN